MRCRNSEKMHNHIKNSHNLFLYNSKYCIETYMSIFDIMKHYSIFHKDEIYKCPYCEKCNYQIYYLK